MQGYVETDQCREKYIRTYFGEKKISDCGHCDNCLDEDQDNKEMVTDGKGVEKIRNILQVDAKTISEIVRETGLSYAQTWQTLSFLMREEYVESEDETYRWKS